MYPKWDEPAIGPLTDEQKAGISPSLSCQEICIFRDAFIGWLPGPRYVEEMNQEILRIHTQRKELQARQAYWGPTVMGQTGELRLRIMACCTIRRRWEAMGIWNPTLEVPILTGTLGLAPDWPWPSSDPKPHYGLPSKVATWAWPSRTQELWHERSVRKYLEGNGEWVNPNSQWKLIAGSDVGENLADHPLRPVSKDNREEFLVGQTWYRFELEVAELTIKAQRVHPNLMSAYDYAYGEVVARWKQRRAWQDWWVSGPAWDPPEGVTLPEPEPVDQMSFSDMERHALGIVDWMQRPMLEITADDLALAPDEPFNLSDGDPSDVTGLEDDLFEAGSSAPGTPTAGPSAPAQFSTPPDTDSPPRPRKTVRFDLWPTLVTQNPTTPSRESALWAHLRAYGPQDDESDWAPPRPPTPPPSPRLVSASLRVQEEDEVKEVLGDWHWPRDEETESDEEADGGPANEPTPASDATTDQDAEGEDDDGQEVTFSYYPWWTDGEPEVEYADPGNVPDPGNDDDDYPDPAQDAGSGSGSRSESIRARSESYDGDSETSELPDADPIAMLNQRNDDWDVEMADAPPLDGDAPQSSQSSVLSVLSSLDLSDISSLELSQLWYGAAQAGTDEEMEVDSISTSPFDQLSSGSEYLPGDSEEDDSDI
jgi:hypothetical protein